MLQTECNFINVDLSIRKKGKEHVRNITIVFSFIHMSLPVGI